MLPYWILFGIWAAGAVQYNRRSEHARHGIFLFFAAVATALFIGLRLRVGGDWGAYRHIYDQIALLDLYQGLFISDPAYSLLNWIAAWLGLDVWAVNTVCACLFMWGLTRFASRQTNPWLAILVGVPYLIIVVAMGYTRQATAIGIALAGLSAGGRRSLARLVIYLLAASMFHKTAVLLLPVALLPVIRRNALTAIVGAVTFVGLYVLVLHSSADTMVSAYANSNYDSQGAAVRVVMNVLAATLLLVFRNRLGFADDEREFWTACAVLSFASLVALGLLSASAGVDRLALFLIPLQLAVFSRLPYARSGTNKADPMLLLFVIGYSFAVQFTWLNYANNAMYWVPYHNELFAA